MASGIATSEEAAITRFLQRHSGYRQMGNGSAVALAPEMEPEAFTTYYRWDNGRKGVIRITELPRVLAKRDKHGNPLFSATPPQIEKGSLVTAGAAEGLAADSDTRVKRRKRRRRGKRGH